MNWKWLGRFVSVCLLTSGCFRGELTSNVVQDMEQKVLIEGTVCATKEALATYPVKLLFLVEHSGKAIELDPFNQRYRAILDLVNDYAASPHVSFQVHGFSRWAIGLRSDNDAAGFVRGQAAINAQIEAIQEFEIGKSWEVSYSHILEWAARVFAVEYEEEFWECSNTRLITIVMGFTELDPSDDLEIATNVSSLLAYEDIVLPYRDVTVHAVDLLEGEGINRGLLKIAERGGGEYLHPVSLSDLDLAELEYENLPREFSLYRLIASNQNVLPTLHGVAVDSDADGVHDVEEHRAGTNPVMADTDGDGCSDGVEAALQWPALEANGLHCVCENAFSLMDSDSDGLGNCEEQFIGGEPLNPDSDVDGVMDGLEFIFGSYLNLADSTRDEDHDGFENSLEIRRHRGVLLPDDEDTQSWAYTYRLSETTEPVVGEGACTQFVVENIAVMRREGIVPDVNLVRVTASFVGYDGGRPTLTYQQAVVPVSVVETESTYVLSSSDFQTL